VLSASPSPYAAHFKPIPLYIVVWGTGTGVNWTTVCPNRLGCESR
jgi:hypothetical protein